MFAPERSRRAGGIALAAVALAALPALSGCGTSDTDRGRQLFVQKCGTCHAMSQAGTSATIGPDLDASFAQARAAGMDSQTIEGVVKAQIENPRPAAENHPEITMPPHLVEGQDLDDVSAYVAEYAGVPGAKPPQAPGGPGGQIFADNGCGGCHTLQDVNAAGTLGPNLDEAIPKMSDKEIEQSIVDPSAKIAPGYPDAMPDTFGDTLTPEDLKLLVTFLMDSAGKSAAK